MQCKYFAEAPLWLCQSVLTWA